MAHLAPDFGPPLPFRNLVNIHNAEERPHAPSAVAVTPVEGGPANNVAWPVIRLSLTGKRVAVNVGDWRVREGGIRERSAVMAVMEEGGAAAHD
jgi:hypothetical protein